MSYRLKLLCLAAVSCGTDVERVPASVRIEIRSMPAMTIQKDGHKLGTTPFSFNMPGSNYPIVLRADWVERRYYRSMQMKEVPRVLFRIVYPNDTQAIDFNGFTAK
jgi:hypothetical protein